jgi:putative tricarboxylic transport membrane protein
MWYANIIAGAAFFLLGVATITLAWLDLPYTADFSPGPGFLPLWLGIGLTIFSVPVIVTDLRNRDTSGKLFRPETVKCVRVLALVVAVFLLLPIFGFSAGLALITGGGMRLMGKHGWGACAAMVIVTAVCIHYLFGQWLSIPLPGGMIGW